MRNVAAFKLYAVINNTNDPSIARKVFVEFLGLPLSILEKPKGNKRKSWESHDEEAEKLLNFGKSEGEGAEKKKVKAAGESRKEELNKKAAKGMKSMAAFFMVKKKK